MAETSNRSYEGLFLFPQSASADLQACVDHIREILSRSQAEILALKKWDERRLAYDIRGNKRGVYFLAYFSAKPGALASIERDCNLSERMLRSLVVRVELSDDEMRAHDGTTQLADEIKLRASGETAPAAAAPEAAAPTTN